MCASGYFDSNGNLTDSIVNCTGTIMNSVILCYSASSYVEAVSTRVNSEMAILAQRILMLWPVQNSTHVDKHSGINLEYE